MRGGSCRGVGVQGGGGEGWAVARAGGRGVRRRREVGGVRAINAVGVGGGDGVGAGCGLAGCQAQFGGRVAGGEAAARVNAITPEQLAGIYRAQSAAGVPTPDATGSGERRAQLFVSAETEISPLRKTRAIRSFLDDARHADLYLTALRMIAPTSQTLALAPEIGWYAETGVEIALAIGEYDRARSWVSVAVSAGALGNADLAFSLMPVSYTHLRAHVSGSTFFFPLLIRLLVLGLLHHSCERLHVRLGSYVVWMLPRLHPPRLSCMKVASIWEIC